VSSSIKHLEPGFQRCGLLFFNCNSRQPEELCFSTFSITITKEILLKGKKAPFERCSHEEKELYHSKIAYFKTKKQ